MRQMSCAMSECIIRFPLNFCIRCGRGATVLVCAVMLAWQAVWDVN